MFLRPSQPSGPSIFSSQKPTHPSSGNHREQSHVGFTAALKHSCLGLIQTFLLVYSFVHFTWSFYFMCSRFNVVAELSLKDFTKFEWTSVVFNIIIGAHLQVLLHHKKNTILTGGLSRFTPCFCNWTVCLWKFLFSTQRPVSQRKSGTIPTESQHMGPDFLKTTAVRLLL